MRRVFALVTIIVLCLVSVGAATEQQPGRLFTIDDLLKVRRVADPQLSRTAGG
jgi:hypothetical protein